MDGSSQRAEAERWLYTADKLLSARDLHGARSFAIRARESDPTFDVTELLITIIDTLLAAENLINNQRDWYGILQILRYTQNVEFIASQYHKLALLLDPSRNRFAFSGHAISLVQEAWSVLSNPMKKALYDNELRLATDPRSAPIPDLFAPQPGTNLNPDPYPPQKPRRKTPARRNRRQNDGRAVVEEERPSLRSLNNATPKSSAQFSEPTRSGDTMVGSSSTGFWTSCPYCYFMYEYQNVYKDCTLKCQSCGRAFHAVAIPAPPVTGKDDYFCCWGVFPLGFSGDFKELSGGSSKWSPFTSMFACPLQKASNKKSRSMKGPWVYYNDEAAAAFVELSDSTEDDSDDDWRTPGNNNNKKKKKKRKKAKHARGRRVRGDNIRRAITDRVDRPRRGNHSGSGNGNLENGEVLEAGESGVALKATARAESSKKSALTSSRKRGAADLGNLDLNVEFSNNEAEEPASSASVVHAGNRAGNGEEDNIEGIGFFEGLDEFLNSLPILNVVADNDKVKGH